MAGLGSKATRIDRSGPLVQTSLAEPAEIGGSNRVPDKVREMVYLRIPGPGAMDYLERQYNATVGATAG